MADPVTDALREAAAHRGYRLQRSRKKTPGVGDFGKFGLTDAKGKPVLGIGDKGLTATADEIEAFLRSGESATWRQSAALPADRRQQKMVSKVEADPSSEPVVARKSATSRKTIRSTPEPTRTKKAASEPDLVIRAAKPDDIAAIARFLSANGSGSKAAVAKRIAAVIEAQGAILVAERRAIIGCLAWTAVPALHREPVARIATLLVADKHQREGIGRALVREAETLLAGAGYRDVEVMSAIEIRSAHGFFRKLGFEETSYRFAKLLSKLGQKHGA